MSQSPAFYGVEEGEFDRPKPPPAEAPWFEIPDRELLAVEHPAVVTRSTDRAVRMLGGGKAIAQAFKPNPENISEPNGLELRFRPGDALAPPIQGKPAKTRAMLLKITVPKGKAPGPSSSSNDHGHKQDIPKLLKSLNGKFQTEVIGHVDHSIRFRDMADYQWNTRNSAWSQNIEENLMELDLQAIKRLRMSDAITADASTEILRPPRFTHINYPFVYGFRQNPAIKLDTDVNGLPVLINAGARVQLQTQYGNWNSDTVPQSSPSKPPAGPKAFTDCLRRLQELFEERPIWTRRGLYNNMPSELWTQLKWAYTHVAYYWRSGPWRDTYVKFGVDPRSGKEYGQYQVVAFKVQTRKRRGGSGEKKGHIFDGENLVLDGKIWQFCDLTDPLLKELADINKCEARETCDHTDGWYPNNRHFKIKYIMRRKLSALIAGKRLDDKAFEAILKEPDSAAPGTLPPRKQVMYYVTKGERTKEMAELEDKMDIEEAGDEETDESMGEELVDELGEEFESDSQSDGDEEEEATKKDKGKKTAEVSERDERLQKLMERFMESQQNEAEGPPGRAASEDDFELLGDAE